MVNRFGMLLGFLLLVNALLAQSFPQFYYYQGQPYYLDYRPDQIHIRFESGFDINNRDTFLSQKLGTLLKSQRPTVSGWDILVELNDWLDGPQMAQLVQSLTAEVEVLVATPVYRHDRVRQIITDEFIVGFRPGVSTQEIEQLNQQYGATVQRVNASGLYYLKAPSGVDAMTMANQYAQEAIVAFAEPNFIYPHGDLLHATVNDPLWSSQWAHRNTGQSVATGASVGPSTVNGSPDADMDVDQAWDITTGDPNIIVAIVDTGTDLDHPDLQANIVGGYDPTENDFVPNDDTEGHGTATSGVVAAVGNNGIGVAGIAYNCKIMPIRIFDDGGSSSDQWIADGINWAWQNGADVLNNSWGGGSPSTAIESAISDAKTQGRGGKGCVILFSSGNDGRDPVNYPAYLTDVIAVGATSMFDEKKNPGSGDQQHWWGGNYGKDLDIVAPTIVYTTDIAGADGYTSGDYNDTFNGTSAACPNAAGVAALVLSVDSNLTANQVQDILQKTADKIEKYAYNSSGWNKHVGYGRVNAYKAVLAAQGQDATHPIVVHTRLQPTSNTAAQVVEATIIDDTGLAGGSLQPKVYYRVNTGSGFGSWQEVIDTDGPSGNVYQFIIPGQSHGTQVEYYIVAHDNSSNQNQVTYPFGANVTGVSGSAATPFTFRVDNFTALSYSGTGPSWGIFGGTATATLTVPDNFVIADLDLKVSGTGNTSSILIGLEAPSGTRAGPFVNTGGSGGWSNTNLDDEATTTLASSSNPFTGDFLPDNALWVFDGENASGTWTLRIYVDGLLNSGEITSWTLSFNSDEVPDQGLPVFLNSFQALVQKDGVLLRWETASEINNQGFEIWRAEDRPENFRLIADYNSDPALQGAGNSSQTNVYEYRDFQVQPGMTYYYKLADVDLNGNRTFHGPLKVKVVGDGVEVLEAGNLPREFKLSPAYPNPFNPETQLRFAIPRNSRSRTEYVRLLVFDTLGRKVKTLYEGQLAPGYYQSRWNGRTDAGRPVASGTYYILLIGEYQRQSQKVTLMK
ncbi:MAG: S8 family serine peptidase [Calditrichaeota bacterium]|nr:S8 family serine peptidase [Calditrichota bacterium]